MKVPQLSKAQAQFLCFRRSLSYEWDYFLRKLKPLQLLIFIILLIGAVITGLSDTQSFFGEIADYVPKELSFLRDKQIILILSASIISFLYFLAWLYELLKASNEASDLANITQAYLVPLQITALKRFKTSIKKSFGLSDRIRISIFVPIRTGFLRWRFQMVCGTENIPERELQAHISLNEGVLGYTFLKSQKHCMEFVDLSDPKKLPATYTLLSQENFTLINRELKGVLVAAAFQEGSIAGLLAIDTDEFSDLVKMQEYQLHSDALDWIIDKSEMVKLLWRMKNDV